MTNLSRLRAALRRSGGRSGWRRGGRSWVGLPLNPSAWRLCRLAPRGLEAPGYKTLQPYPRPPTVDRRLRGDDEEPSGWRSGVHVAVAAPYAPCQQLMRNETARALALSLLGGGDPGRGRSGLWRGGSKHRATAGKGSERSD